MTDTIRAFRVLVHLVGNLPLPLEPNAFLKRMSFSRFSSFLLATCLNNIPWYASHIEHSALFIPPVLLRLTYLSPYSPWDLQYSSSDLHLRGFYVRVLISLFLLSLDIFYLHVTFHSLIIADFPNTIWHSPTNPPLTSIVFLIFFQDIRFWKTSSLIYIHNTSLWSVDAKCQFSAHCFHSID